MSLNFTTYVSQLANLLVISSADTNFQTQLPGIIDGAEQRLYRELDLLTTRITDSTVSLSSGNRLLGLSTAIGNFLVVEEVNVITPSTATSTSGTLNPLTNVSQAVLDIAYPSNTTATGVPQYWAMRDSSDILVGPPPDAPYLIQIVGTQRPTSLSSNNSSTFLTNVLPDLFMAASMVYATAYLKNFGAQSDDPRSGMSWDQLYQKYMQSAMVEELRKKYASQAWTSQVPNPIATPPRA